MVSDLKVIAARRCAVMLHNMSQYDMLMEYVKLPWAVQTLVVANLVPLLLRRQFEGTSPLLAEMLGYDRVDVMFQVSPGLRQMRVWERLSEKEKLEIPEGEVCSRRWDFRIWMLHRENSCVDYEIDYISYF